MYIFKLIKTISLSLSIILTFSGAAFSADNQLLNLDITTSFPAIIALLVFVAAYALVMVEEYTHMRKSKPVIIAAGFIWAVVAYMAVKMGLDVHAASYSFKHTFFGYFSYLIVFSVFPSPRATAVHFLYSIYIYIKGYLFRPNLTDGFRANK